MRAELQFLVEVYCSSSSSSSCTVRMLSYTVLFPCRCRSMSIPTAVAAHGSRHDWPKFSELQRHASTSTELIPVHLHVLLLSRCSYTANLPGTMRHRSQWHSSGHRSIGLDPRFNTGCCVALSGLEVFWPKWRLGDMYSARVPRLPYSHRKQVHGSFLCRHHRSVAIPHIVHVRQCRKPSKMALSGFCLLFLHQFLVLGAGLARLSLYPCFAHTAHGKLDRIDSRTVPGSPPSGHCCAPCLVETITILTLH
ncbi:hypothetical protein N656DRAFT_44068 [Canariomyces notabilis]|uniref:Uncharacterized protein n=1 Tax=Canariomyces notabilis TaxID=2074819 RepID=A0AAN6YXA9_9PEZI|nr:hypothetical protein N656DRAFT_44068 [Canariomyces arenarius]